MMKKLVDTKRDLAAFKTRKKILKAACSLFVKNGFDGVSISEIAKKAGINQSLIYHYYDSKEELWKKVKSYLAESCIKPNEAKLHADKGLKHVLEQIVHTRFEFYEKNPEIMRMMGWQRLENTRDKLAGGTFFSPDTWKEAFLQLQKKGQIRKEIDLDMMILFITSVIAGALTEDHQKKLTVPEHKSLYLDMIVNCFLISFGKSD